MLQQPHDVSDKTLSRRPITPAKTIPMWLLLLLLTSSAVSLVATAAFLVRSTASQTRTLQRVTLMVAAEQRDIETTAPTVALLLREQGITLADDDALSVPLETPLQDGMVITIDRARDVTLIVDGQQRILRTPLTHPQAILENQTLTVSETDRIWLDGTLATRAEMENWPVPAQEIEVQRTVSVTIMDNGTALMLDTAEGTVGEMLYEAEIELFMTDLVEPTIDTPLVEGMTITIDRAHPVSILVDGVEIETRVQDGTVLDALSEAGLALVGLDYTIPAETETITSDMTIRVLRVTEGVESSDENIAYERVLQADPALELDQQQVIQAGQAGVLRISERVRYENGIEVGREPLGSEIIQPEQNQVTAYGTNIVLRTVITPDGPREYWRKLRVYATSYHPAALGGDNITSIGETLRKGIVGANPNIIPYRTDVFVPGYGTGFIADTGGARSSPYWIDLGYSDEDYRGWSQYVDIYLLTPVPANIDYLLPAWRPMRGLPDN